jgi:NADH-quinone oxidoreductase subunit A
MDFTLATWYPMLIFMVAAVGFGIAALVVTHMVGPAKRTAVKGMPYESGMDPIGDARQRFDVKFYLIAILFLVFDVELLFLYPWAAAYQEGPEGTLRKEPFGTFVFVEIILFLTTIVIGYIYAWRRGVFRWR